MCFFIVAKGSHKNCTKHNVKNANIHIQNLKNKTKQNQVNEYWTKVKSALSPPWPCLKVEPSLNINKKGQAK